MRAIRKTLLWSVLGLFMLSASAQRTYKNASVLSTGNWYKFSVSSEGVYKIDLNFLNSLGISGTISSSSIRIYGNGGAMLPEANSALPPDDLTENAIMVVDGGDGQFNGPDYLLFYARGPHHWEKDSVNKRFTHKKNLYSEKAFYFLTINGSGLRIPTAPSPGPGGLTVNTYDERYFYELDTVNFLSSGKEWYGEEFSNAPGRTLSKTFALPFVGLLSQPATLVTHVAARSVNIPSRFVMSVNNTPVQQLDVNQISTALYDVFAQQALGANVFVQNGPTAQVSLTYQPGSFNSQGWLDWFEYFGRHNLLFNPGKQLFFRDWNSVGSGTIGFSIAGSDPNSQIWDITDPLHPVRVTTTVTGSTISFTADAQRLREYVGFSTSYLTPEAIGPIPNQNLHSTSEKDYLIVTYPPFLSQAQRLQDFHFQRSGLRTQIVTTDQVFNEFSSGIPDPTAIRDFVKMYYDRYAASWNSSGRYLLLMGRGSFDYKNRVNNNTNLLPAYESTSSLDPLSTYTTDDFFGFLEDHEDINPGPVVNSLDIGTGRIPARNIDEAKNFVDKVMDYHASQSFGPWRNQLNFIADDEDFNLHLQDAEVMTATVTATAPVFNIQKIYLDAFQQESGSSGGRYPAANAVINSNIYNGTLVWNYSGHGGPLRLAEEVVLDQQIVNGWSNRYRLPLFITATCDFAPYDNPAWNSLGENLLVRPSTGAIALMTTTRVVFAFSNRILNNNYLRFAFEQTPSGNYRSLGEALLAAKNYTYQTSSDITNNRKFTLLGDPAMTLAFPAQKVRTTRVNGKDISLGADTLSATELVVLDGEVTDVGGTLLADFQGTAYLSLFDKPRQVTTQANDATSTPVSFSDQQNSLFRGKATVENGQFSFRFKVPKDINFQYGNGKISLYAQDGTRDGNGFSTDIIIGGIAAGGSSDVAGPEIKAWLNDDRFVNGGITNARPVLILHLADSSGINTGGSGVDHDIVATLDNNNQQYFILNNFFESDLDNYQAGGLRFQLPQLAAGAHFLKIKAWDVMNNSSEYILEFTVVENSELKIDHVLNYPNPFSSKTAFWFEHNQPGVDLGTRVEIYTVSGKLIKTLARTINTTGNRSNEIEWDGRDDYGNKIGRGVYIYRLWVRTPDGKKAEKWERLVLLSN